MNEENLEEEMYLLSGEWIPDEREEREDDYLLSGEMPYSFQSEELDE